MSTPFELSLDEEWQVETTARYPIGFSERYYSVHTVAASVDLVVHLGLEADGRRQVREIAARKMPDLNANTVDAAMRMIEGTARSMGIEVIE